MEAGRQYLGSREFELLRLFHGLPTYAKWRFHYCGEAAIHKCQIAMLPGL